MDFWSVHKKIFFRDVRSHQSPGISRKTCNSWIFFILENLERSNWSNKSSFFAKSSEITYIKCRFWPIYKILIFHDFRWTQRFNPSSKTVRVVLQSHKKYNWKSSSPTLRRHKITKNKYFCNRSKTMSNMDNFWALYKIWDLSRHFEPSKSLLGIWWRSLPT